MNDLLYKIGHFFTSRSKFIRMVNRNYFVPAMENVDNLKARIAAYKKGKNIEIDRNNYVYKLEKRDTSFFLPLYSIDYIQRIMFLTGDYYNSNTNDELFNKWGNGIIGESVKGGSYLM